MNDDSADSVTSEQDPRLATDSDLRDLVKAAFEKARISGKTPWDLMTVAVLKNRLLDLTDHHFSEHDYGFASMTDLARNLSDIIALDDSVRPASVKLQDDVEITHEQNYSGLQVRSDLWSAILDYSRGEPYLWIGDSAVPQGLHGDSATGQVIPTITPAEEATWRGEFQARVDPTLDEDQRRLLQQWIDKKQSPKILPSPFQRQWNNDLKCHVIDRLRTWFVDAGIPEPIDFLVPFRRSSTHASAQTRRLTELRALVIRCVQNMTEEELSELRLSPQILLRGDK